MKFLLLLLIGSTILITGCDTLLNSDASISIKNMSETTQMSYITFAESPAKQVTYELSINKDLNLYGCTLFYLTNDGTQYEEQFTNWCTGKSFLAGSKYTRSAIFDEEAFTKSGTLVMKLRDTHNVEHTAKTRFEVNNNTNKSNY